MGRRPRQGRPLGLVLSAAAAGNTEASYKGGHEPELFLLLRRSLVVVVDEFVDCFTHFRRAVVAITAVLVAAVAVIRAVHGIQYSPRQAEGPRRCAGFGEEQAG